MGTYGDIWGNFPVRSMEEILPGNGSVLLTGGFSSAGNKASPTITFSQNFHYVTWSYPVELFPVRVGLEKKVLLRLKKARGGDLLILGFGQMAFCDCSRTFSR